MTPLLAKYLPLSSNTSSATGAADEKLHKERQKDHYSHYILRLAFAGTEDLRRRFVRLESMLFKLRFQTDDTRERQAFVDNLAFDWETVSETERNEMSEELLAATVGLKRLDEEGWFKVDWEKVPELVERRAVVLKRGKAYVPLREQLSMVLAEFSTRLERAMEVILCSIISRMALRWLIDV